MLARFADDAELRFENVPAGPFVGLDAIRRGYREQPPDDRSSCSGSRRTTSTPSSAAFAWTRGGTGRLVLEHDRGAVTQLIVVFDQ